MSAVRVHHMLLKNDLFSVLGADIDDLAELFHRFSYPDVGSLNRRAFLLELRRRLEDREALIEEFGFHMLKGVIDAGMNMDSLIYLENEEPNRLIDSFAEFFIPRICLFKNAHHFLDVEPVIQARFATYRFRDGDAELDNFTFVDSQAEPGIQASDVLVGLLGKLFSYLSRTSSEQLIADRLALLPQQMRALEKLNVLLDRSNSETPAMFQQVISLSALRGGRFFFDGS